VEQGELKFQINPFDEGFYLFYDSHVIVEAFASLRPINSFQLSEIRSQIRLEISKSPEWDVVTYPLFDKLNSEYFIYLLVDGFKVIEILRQNKNWLEKTFRFSVQNGYLIQGRILTVVSEKELFNEIEIFSKTPLESSKHLEEAKALLSLIFGKPYADGPSKLVLKKTENWVKKLERIHKGEISVQCQEFRDLFIEMCSALSNIKIRPINCISKSAGLAGLIVPSHAITEIYLDEMNQWMAFDPYMGGLYFSRKGKILSVHEIMNLTPLESNHIEMNVMFSKFKKLLIDQENNHEIVTFDSSLIKKDEWSITQTGYIQGYFWYFGEITVPETNSISKILNCIKAAFKHHLSFSISKNV
jgi:hypothetical protein